MKTLALSELRVRNVQRVPLFKNSRGETIHKHPEGFDWTYSQWSNALAGEAGELANKIKKFERGDFTLEEAIPLVAGEAADVLIQLDLLAHRFGIDLALSTIEKFNYVSEHRAHCPDIVLIGMDTPSLAPQGLRKMENVK